MNGSKNVCFLHLREFAMLQADWQATIPTVNVRFNAKYIAEELWHVRCRLQNGGKIVCEIQWEKIIRVVATGEWEAPAGRIFLKANAGHTYLVPENESLSMMQIMTPFAYDRRPR